MIDTASASAIAVVDSARDVIVSNNVIIRGGNPAVGSRGILVSNSGFVPSKNVRVVNNAIRSVGYSGQANIGIHVKGDGHFVSGNRVYTDASDTGYGTPTGIYLDAATNASVTGNDVSGSSRDIGLFNGSTGAYLSGNIQRGAGQFIDGTSSAQTLSIVAGALTADAAGKWRWPLAPNQSGTPGNVTSHTAAGIAAIAAGASSVVVTNSLVGTTSLVYAVLQASDATATFIKSVIPASGSFTINVNANATANTKVAWVVFN